MGNQEENRYTPAYHPLVSDDVRRLDQTWKERIFRAIEERLLSQPELFGKPLRRSLKSHRTMRVGDYRVVYRIDGAVVRIIAIIHRSVVYEKVIGRI